MANVASSIAVRGDDRRALGEVEVLDLGDVGRSLVYDAYTFIMPTNSAMAATPKTTRMMRGSAVEPGRRRGRAPAPAARSAGPAAVVVGSFARQGSTEARGPSVGMGMQVLGTEP